MMPRVKGHPLARMIIYSVIAAVIGTVAVLLLDWFPTPASTVAGDIDLLYDVLLVASVPIFVLVMAVAIYSVVKFRARPGDLGDGAPIHGNTRLEVIWVTIPFILVTALAVYGWIVLDDIEAKEPNTLVVDVRGQQFAWRFTYPGENNLKSNQLVLPKDRPVEFRVTTNDVIHSFWVPQFRLKTDTVPGLTTKLRVTPNKLGRFDVVCAELCGLGHATMRQKVRVVPPGEFTSWAANARKQQSKVGGETPPETENPEKAPQE
jgi:cytochrome c oxidase subunit II